MKILLDTHILLWAVGAPHLLPIEAAAMIEDTNTNLVFSPASLWEVAIKNTLGRPDFRVDPHILRRGLLDHGYEELPISGAHAVALMDLPPIHKDPFDRMLIAQARAEGMILLTADPLVAQYPGPITKV